MGDPISDHQQGPTHSPDVLYLDRAHPSQPRVTADPPHALLVIAVNPATGVR
jgi:hypothetical protein